MVDSPYSDVPETEWQARTKQLIARHPLHGEEIVQVVLQAWEDIFNSHFGSKGFRIGEHIFPKPQIMGFFLHELIPLEFEERYPGAWCGERCATDKDLVYIPDPNFSVEIKTSSARGHVFGNRSYAQDPEIAKKSKSGYYLTVNFGKFEKRSEQPEITLVRFGWLDHTDWIGQTAATGQQARISGVADRCKLLPLYVRK